MSTVERSEQIARNFQRFNHFGHEATENLDTDVDAALVYAMLSIAFELSQLRYFMTRRNDDHGG